MVAKELVLIVILAAIVFVFINIQPTHAPKECSSCIQFKKITQDLEKNLKNVVRDPPLKPEVPIRKLLDNNTQIYEGLFANNNFLEELFNRENEYKQSVSTLLEDLESIKQEKNEMDLMSDVETGQELMNQLNSNNIQRVHDGNGSTIIKITIKDGTTGNSSDYFIHDVKTLDKEPDFKKIIIGTTTQDGSESLEQCKASSGTPSKSVSHCGAMGLMQ